MFFPITVAMHMRTSYCLKWFCTILFHCRYLLFTWKTHCGSKFHFSQIDWTEICTKVSFTLPELMWTLIMKLCYTQMKFYTEVKYQTVLSSLQVSCKNVLKDNISSIGMFGFVMLIFRSNHHNCFLKKVFLKIPQN